MCIWEDLRFILKIEDIINYMTYLPNYFHITRLLSLPILQKSHSEVMFLLVSIDRCGIILQLYFWSGKTSLVETIECLNINKI